MIRLEIKRDWIVGKKSGVLGMVRTRMHNLLQKGQLKVQEIRDLD